MRLESYWAVNVHYSSERKGKNDAEGDSEIIRAVIFTTDPGTELASAGFSGPGCGHHVPLGKAALPSPVGRSLAESHGSNGKVKEQDKVLQL